MTGVHADQGNEDYENKRSPEEGQQESSSERKIEKQKNTTSDEDTVIPEEIRGVMESLPNPARRSIMSFFQGRIPSDGHPLYDKFTSEHIDKWLDYVQKDDDNEYKLLSTNRFFYLFYFVFGIAAFFVLVFVLLPNDKELLQDILKIIVVFAGGFGSGYGLKSYFDRKK